MWDYIDVSFPGERERGTRKTEKEEGNLAGSEWKGGQAISSLSQQLDGGASHG